MFPFFARGQNEPFSDHFSLKEAFTTGNLDAVITVLQPLEFPRGQKDLLCGSSEENCLGLYLVMPRIFMTTRYPNRVLARTSSHSEELTRMRFVTRVKNS
ncbi:MAG: hypothetical protein CMN04_11665 [Roseibacillus sp.]|nr:hypothetical protein [Roseibacillus sp.]